MSGSTSVAPLAAKLIKRYLKPSECNHCVKFKLLQGGSDVGIDDVAHGRVTIGNSSRDPDTVAHPIDAGLHFNMIAHDAICIITNAANPITSLSNQNVKDLFHGTQGTWAGFNGSPRTGNVDIFVRTAASGTQDAFNKIFMKGTSISGAASQKASNGLIQQSVHGDKDGVGYVSLAFTGGVHAAPYQGVACNLRNAKSGKYLGLRNFYMVTRHRPAGAVKKWIKWIRHDKNAKKITASGWVPLS